MFGKCKGKSLNWIVQEYATIWCKLFVDYNLKLGDIFNNALKYCMIAMDLMFQKVTLTLFFIVKCMEVYIFKTLYN